ncbi:DUF1203 domain-containing protein [Cereibacter sphaeroides]|nr:DUF1203 domain-containing protein [Cereibacter sphaeroides]
MQPVFLPLPEAATARYRAGLPDAYGLTPERRVVGPGDGVPCRNSLQRLPEGAEYLIVAHRPFDGLNPYAETGPIFLGAEGAAAAASPDLPPFLTAPSYITRAYGDDERILYGTGAVTRTEDIIARCTELLSDPQVAFVHIRSASNNCFHCRVERG